MAGALGAPLKAACLQDVRSVIRLSGSGLVHFLQGLVTNDVSALEAPGAPAQYACILNAQGRHLHDLLLHRTQDAEPTVLVDADRQGAPDLLRLLTRYRLRQKVDIADASRDFSVWARFGGGDAALRAACAAPPAGWAPDPRLWQLGLRAVLPAGADGGSGGGGGAPGQALGTAGWRDHRRWRMLHGVAEGDTEMPAGQVPLEFNIDGLRGISFTKGCYVGQELMARTHFKGVVRKRLMPFVLAPLRPGGAAAAAAAPAAAAGPGWAPGAARAAAEVAVATGYGEAAAGGVQPGDAVYVEQPGGKRRAVGVVRVVDGPLGLAVLRLSAVSAAQAAGQTLLVGEGEAAAGLWPWRPNWWPEAWGTEDAAGGGDADA